MTRQKTREVQCQAAGTHQTLQSLWTVILKSNFVVLFTAKTEADHNSSEQIRLRVLLSALTLT